MNRIQELHKKYLQKVYKNLRVNRELVYDNDDKKIDINKNIKTNTDITEFYLIFLICIIIFFIIIYIIKNKKWM